MSEVKKTSFATRYTKHRFMAPPHSQGNGTLCVGGVRGSGVLQQGVIYPNAKCSGAHAIPRSLSFFCWPKAWGAIICIHPKVKKCLKDDMMLLHDRPCHREPHNPSSSSAVPPPPSLNLLTHPSFAPSPLCFHHRAPDSPH
jgi:hypothetical protein